LITRLFFGTFKLAFFRIAFPLPPHYPVSCPSL